MRDSVNDDDDDDAFLLAAVQANALIPLDDSHTVYLTQDSNRGGLKVLWQVPIKFMWQCYVKVLIIYVPRYI